MKIKLLIITILLLFVSLSSEIIALEIPITNEVELVLEEKNSEKEVKEQDLILQKEFYLISLEIKFSYPSSVYLYNYPSKDYIYRPPISLSSS